MRRISTALLFFAALACSPPPAPDNAERRAGTSPAGPRGDGLAEAIFAGGCFWCMEATFESLEGVRDAVSGYTGGRTAAPTYEEVSRGDTGHVEAVRVIYDPRRIDYATLLEVYFRNVDPTQADGQFCDRGDRYRSAIFVLDEEQRRLAEAALERVRERLGRDVVTTIEDAGPFWVAEDYHQDYYRTNPARYHAYRAACGRDRQLREVWGEPAAH